MKQVSILMLMILNAASVPAQTELARLDIGRKEPLPQYFEYCPADGGIVTYANLLNHGNKSQGITKYNEAFEREWTKEILEQNGHRSVEFIAILGNKIFIFVSEFLPREKIIQTWYSQFDLDGNEIENHKKLAEFPNDKEQRTDLKFSLSLNKKKLLCYKVLDSFQESEIILYYSFDQINGFEGEGKIELPYPQDRFVVKNIIPGNQGNIFLLGKYFETSRIQSPDDFSFVLFRKGKEASNLERKDIIAEDKFITDLSMKADREENIYLAGFYSTKRTDAIIGTVFQKLNQSLEVEISSAEQFSEKFLSAFLSEKQIDKGRELRFFYLDNIILRSDGGVLLVAEKFYTSYNSYLDIYGYWVDMKVYHYDDIIVSSVSADGSLEWSSVVSKHQSGEMRDYLSYSDIVSGATLYLLYTYQPKKQAETIYFNTVNDSGAVAERRQLLGTIESEFLLPSESMQISNSEALLVYYQPRQKIYSILKMAFE